MSLVAVLLSACGSSGQINEDFDTVEAVPEYLRSEDLVVGVGQTEFADGFLRLIVQNQGIGEVGRLFIEPNAEAVHQDFALEVTMRFISNGRATLWLRSDAETCSGYGLVIDPTRDNFRLATAGENCDIENLDTRSRLAIDLDQWYTLRFEVQGSTLRGYVDTVQFFEIEDSTYTEGQSFIEIMTDSSIPAQIEIDTFKVD